MIDRFDVGLGFFGQIRDRRRSLDETDFVCVCEKKKKMLLTLKEEDRRKDEVFDYRKRKGNERLEFLPNVNFSKKTRKNIFPVLILEKEEWNETCTNFDPLEKF